MSKNSLVRAAAALLFLATFSDTVAEAQPWTGERWVRGRPHRIEGEGALFVGNGSVAFSPGFHARFRLVDDQPLAFGAFIVDLDLAARAIGLTGPDDSFRPGNPYVGLRLGYRTGMIRARGGVGTTAPLTNLFADGASDRAAYRMGQAVHGGWDAWLLEPEIQPLILRGDFEIHSRYVSGGVDAAFAVAFPLRRDGGGSTEYAFQTGAFGAITPIPELAFGARLAVFFATDWRVGYGGVDEAQFAFIPFLRMDLTSFFAEFRFFMNLDPPFGFSFDPGGIWAISLTAGARF